MRALLENRIGRDIGSDLSEGWVSVLRIVNHAREVIDLAFVNADGAIELITVTAGHWFATVGNGWIEAGALEIGAQIQTLDGRLVRLLSKLANPISATTYNLTVANDHSYFVGASGIWVHNVCCGGGASRLQNRLDAWKSYQANGGGKEMDEWVASTQRQYGGVSGGYKSGYSDWEDGLNPDLHGNSLNAQGPHDVYVLRDSSNGKLLHFGETGRGYLTRFNDHLRALKKFGVKIQTQLLATVEGKAAAKQLELRYIKTYQKVFKTRPPFNPVNH